MNKLASIKKKIKQPMNRKNKIYVQIGLIICLIIGLNSCVSKKKFSELIKQKEELEDLYSNCADSLSVSGASVGAAMQSNKEKDEIINKLQRDIRYLEDRIDYNYGYYLPSFRDDLFEVSKNCIADEKIKEILKTISNQIEKSFMEKPFGATSIQNSIQNEYSRKLILWKDGKSEIVRRYHRYNRYESVIYIIDLYFDNYSNEVKFEANFITLLAAGRYDDREYLRNSSFIYSYREAIQEEIENIKSDNNLSCLKKI